MGQPQVVPQQEIQEVRQEKLIEVPISRITYTVKSQEQATEMELKPGQLVHGRFSGRVAGLHYDEGATKKGGEITPDWRKKWLINALVVELDGEE